MRKIDEPHDTKNESDSERAQGIEAAERQRVENELKNGLHG
jgi:hypothetical protein